MRVSRPVAAPGERDHREMPATLLSERRSPRAAVARPLLSSTAGQLDAVAPAREAGAMAEDRYMSLKALARYSGLSVRTLRAHIADGMHPLPCYRPSGGAAGKVLVRRSEFDRWMARDRVEGKAALDAMVRAVLGPFREMYAHAIEDGHASANPATGVLRRTRGEAAERRAADFLTREE